MLKLILLLQPFFAKEDMDTLTNQNIENQDEILNESTETKEVAVEQSNETKAESAETETTENPEPTANEAEASETPVHKPDDFDWSMDKAGFGTYNESQNTDLKSMYENTISKVEEKTLVSGKVVSITAEDVVIDIGFKSDGLVSLTEFRDNPELAVGDEVEVLC